MIELSVCIGSACHLKGSYNVIQIFQQLIEEYQLHDKIDLKTAFCMKACADYGVGVCLDGRLFRVQPESAREFFRTSVMPLLG